MEWKDCQRIQLHHIGKDTNVNHHTSPSYYSISLIYKLFPRVLVDYQRIFHKLEASTRSFVDLEPLKQQFLRFEKTAILNQKRKQLGFQVDDLSTQCLHFIFQGNPGTGQTTFARKVAGISSVHMCSIVLSYMFDMIFN